MNSRKSKKPLLGAVAALFLAQAGLQGGAIRDFWATNYSSGKGIAGDLAPDQILLQLLGFREFVSGMLWVRADSFFDEGNYDAVLPIIRVCTILDPKQIDIYATGMWHIAYNFTDEEQRSDRRYIASALALGKEGSRNNPNTYEMFFETGWIWYHKVDDDYYQAVKWFELAQQRADIQPARRNLLNQAYFRNFQIDKSLELYNQLNDEAIKAYDVRDNATHQNKDTIARNFDMTLVRLTQRGYFAGQRNEADMSAYDVSPKFDVGFSAQVTVEEPRVINIVGTWNVMPVGTRIRAIIRDKDNPDAKLGELDWDAKNAVDLDPDKTMTYAQEQLYVKNRRFKKRLDLSRDPTMYPFSEKSKEFLVEFYYSPRSAPPHIQDKFGYNGEGFTDSNFLRTDIRPQQVWDLSKKDKSNYSIVDEAQLKGVPGNQPVMYTTLMLTRDQILRRGQWSAEQPVVRTKNFDPSKATGNDISYVIDVPSVRAVKPGLATTQPGK